MVITGTPLNAFYLSKETIIKNLSLEGLQFNYKRVQEMDLYVTLAYAIQVNQNGQSAVSSNHQL